MEKQTIEFRGKKYKSINKVAEEVGIPSYTLNHRMRQGMSLEDAVREGLKVKRDLEYAGVKFKSIEELAKYVGINANVLVNRQGKKSSG